MAPSTATVRFRVNQSWCKRCGICIAFCPRAVFVENEDGYPEAVHSQACTQCGLCELFCPEQAIGLTVTPDVVEVP